MKDFTVDAAFEAASVAVAEWPLCHVRLQNDGRYCWLILLPRVPQAVELSDLEPAQRAALMEEIVLAGEMVTTMADFEGRTVDKINTAALGNVTRQLHIHVLGRRRDDPLWPDPVWGRPGAISCTSEQLEGRKQIVVRHENRSRRT